jgi:hypothetical protein
MQLGHSAQCVSTHNPWVVGSSPTRPTGPDLLFRPHGGVAAAFRPPGGHISIGGRTEGMRHQGGGGLRGRALHVLAHQGVDPVCRAVAAQAAGHVVAGVFAAAADQ